MSPNNPVEWSQSEDDFESAEVFSVKWVERIVAMRSETTFEQTRIIRADSNTLTMKAI